jgi:hypothetical protein
VTGLRLELPNPHQSESPREYIEKHLAPVITELHRITNELLAPGATSAEEWSADMVPAVAPSPRYTRLDKCLIQMGKNVSFDGAEHLTLSTELLRAKQLKVQLTAVVYVYANCQEPRTVEFRLVRDDGQAITGSEFQSISTEPETVSRTLPFGVLDGCIAPERRTYFIEGRSLGGKSQPVCRRFSLSFVYI